MLKRLSDRLDVSVSFIAEKDRWHRARLFFCRDGHCYLFELPEDGKEPALTAKVPEDVKSPPHLVTAEQYAAMFDIAARPEGYFRLLPKKFE